MNVTAYDVVQLLRALEPLAVEMGYRKPEPVPLYKAHGTVQRYRLGCRCGGCVAGIRRKWREDSARNRTRQETRACPG